MSHLREKFLSQWLVCLTTKNIKDKLNKTFFEKKTQQTNQQNTHHYHQQTNRQVIKETYQLMQS